MTEEKSESQEYRVPNPEREVVYEPDAAEELKKFGEEIDSKTKEKIDLELRESLRGAMERMYDLIAKESKSFEYQLGEYKVKGENRLSKGISFSKEGKTLEFWFEIFPYIVMSFGEETFYYSDVKNEPEKHSNRTDLELLVEKLEKFSKLLEERKYKEIKDF